jgi:hypothetical protein
MSRLLCALCLLAFLPITANATSTASITSTNCSGSLTTSLLDGASFACAGNLTLDGGFVTSDSLINISADGDLFVNNLVFTSPNVTFTALSGTIEIGSGFVVNANSAILTASIINIALGAQFNVPQIAAVPEPSAYAMLLLGLGLISFRRRV